MLELRQVVMNLHDRQESDNYMYFEAPDPAEGETRTDGYHMTVENFLDMECPDAITVSVRPGKHLDDPRIVHRDAGDGRFVTEEYADKNQSTTTQEEV